MKMLTVEQVQNVAGGLSEVYLSTRMPLSAFIKVAGQFGADENFDASTILENINKAGINTEQTYVQVLFHVADDQMDSDDF